MGVNNLLRVVSQQHPRGWAFVGGLLPGGLSTRGLMAEQQLRKFVFCNEVHTVTTVIFTVRCFSMLRSASCYYPSVANDAALVSRPHCLLDENSFHIARCKQRGISKAIGLRVPVHKL